MFGILHYRDWQDYDEVCPSSSTSSGEVSGVHPSGLRPARKGFCPFCSSASLATPRVSSRGGITRSPRELCKSCAARSHQAMGLLPAEIVEHILRGLDPSTLAAVVATARSLEAGGRSSSALSDRRGAHLRGRDVVAVPGTGSRKGVGALRDAIATDNAARIAWMCSHCQPGVDLHAPIPTGMVTGSHLEREYALAYGPMPHGSVGGYRALLSASYPAGFAAYTNRPAALRALLTLPECGPPDVPTGVTLIHLALINAAGGNLVPKEPPFPRKPLPLETVRAVVESGVPLTREHYDDNPLTALRRFIVRNAGWLSGEQARLGVALAREIVRRDPTLPFQRTAQSGPLSSQKKRENPLASSTESDEVRGEIVHVPPQSTQATLLKEFDDMYGRARRRVVEEGVTVPTLRRPKDYAALREAIVRNDAEAVSRMCAAGLIDPDKPLPFASDSSASGTGGLGKPFDAGRFGYDVAPAFPITLAVGAGSNEALRAMLDGCAPTALPSLGTLVNLAIFEFYSYGEWRTAAPTVELLLDHYRGQPLADPYEANPLMTAFKVSTSGVWPGPVGQWRTAELRRIVELIVAHEPSLIDQRAGPLYESDGTPARKKEDALTVRQTIGDVLTAYATGRDVADRSRGYASLVADMRRYPESAAGVYEFIEWLAPSVRQRTPLLSEASTTADAV